MIEYDKVKKWIDYAVYSDDEEEILIGVRDDAPESAKKAYDEYQKAIAEAAKKGISL